MLLFFLRPPGDIWCPVTVRDTAHSLFWTFCTLSWWILGLILYRFTKVHNCHILFCPCSHLVAGTYYHCSARHCGESLVSASVVLKGHCEYLCIHRSMPSGHIPRDRPSGSKLLWAMLCIFKLFSEELAPGYVLAMCGHACIPTCPQSCCFSQSIRFLCSDG